MDLKEYLNKNFMSGYDFAEKSGVGYRTIYRILSGQIRRIPQRVRAKISEATNKEVTFENYY